MSGSDGSAKRWATCFGSDPAVAVALAASVNSPAAANDVATAAAASRPVARFRMFDSVESCSGARPGFLVSELDYLVGHVVARR